MDNADDIINMAAVILPVEEAVLTLNGWLSYDGADLIAIC